VAFQHRWILDKPFVEISDDDFDGMWRINCFAGMAQQVLPNMLDKNEGSLIFTGATAAFKGGDKFAAFTSSKFALRAMAQSLAREFGPQGAHVAHVVIDAIIWSERAKSMFDIDQNVCLQPAAIADNYWFLIQQDRSTWIQELDLRPNMEKY
jgi:NADP-dependent 3-hydroxy acid dehydrogenase YdfG